METENKSAVLAILRDIHARLRVTKKRGVRMRRLPIASLQQVSTLATKDSRKGASEKTDDVYRRSSTIKT